jgi:hypothetical protein
MAFNKWQLASEKWQMTDEIIQNFRWQIKN